MGIGPEQRFARLAETFKMHLVADAVSGAGEDDTVFNGNRLQIFMVVCILEADLNRVMIDVADRQFRLDFRQAGGFELQVGHGAGCILGERLIDLDGDFRSRVPRSLCNM